LAATRRPLHRVSASLTQGRRCAFRM
jgi:hypothetical protein